MIAATALPALFLAVMSYAATPGGRANVYVCDEAVAGGVDISRFERAGEVTFSDGSGTISTSETGPAPAPYPQIRFLGPDFERLGDGDAGSAGVSFYTRGRHEYWKKNGEVFVVWTVRIPAADTRSVVDFAGDLTLSLWVDWDGLHKNVNIARYLPTGDEVICLNYLTSFRVPDVSRMASVSAGSAREHDRDVTYLWVRGSLSYDNPGASPDGDQLYGACEDHRVGYRTNPDPDGTD